MPRVLKRPQAEIDLVDIWLYIAADSVENADRFLEKIEKQCNTLASQPQMGRSRDDLAPSLQSFPIGNYLVFYQPIEDGIEIIRVLHGARDFVRRNNYRSKSIVALTAHAAIDGE